MSGDDSHTLRQLVASNIRLKRVRLGMSQEGLAHKADVHRTYIGAVERAEKNISIDNLEKIARALGIEANLLLLKEAE